MSVKIRYRESKEKTSIYLDIYHNGKRYQKPLERFLINEPDAISLVTNAETMRIVNAMVKDKETEIKDGTFNFDEFKYGKSSTDKIFNDFINTKNAAKTKTMYRGHIETIRAYAGDTLKIQSFSDKQFLIGLLQYFRNNLASNTVILRIRTLKNLIRYLLDMELISKNVWSEIPKHLTAIKPEQTEISYLSIDELNTLANSELRENVKMPFLFSCYTGLRLSDVFALKFSDVRDNTIFLKQQKTQSYNQIPLSKQAIEILKHQRELRPDTIEVFENVPYTPLRIELADCCKELFHKSIHFHCGRHSFAVNALSLGMPITTLQSFLGHTRIEMTLRYAKVLPADKIKAIEIFNNL